MKKLLFTFGTLLLLIVSAMAQKAKITGNWMITTVEKGRKTQDVYQLTSFKDDGYAEIEGRVFGSWKYDRETKTLAIESEMIKEFAGKWKIAKLTKNEMVLQQKDSKLNLMIYDQDKIKRENKACGLLGAWQLTEKNEDDADVYLKFSLPDEIKIRTIGDGYSSKGSGRWFFDKKNGTVMMVVRDRLLRGKSKIITAADDKFVLENNGKKISAVRLRQVEDKETLKIDEDEEDTEEEEAQLNPEDCQWFNAEAKIAYLKRVKKLIYRKKSLLSGFDAFVTENIEAKVSFDENENAVNMEPIFGKYSAEEFDRENPFYPIEEFDDYSLVDDRNVTIPAGTFSCKVIETKDFSENSRIRYYMIKNRPGVYAKVIIAAKNFDDEEEYTMYELSAIEGDFNKQNNKRIIGEWLLVKLKTGGKTDDMSMPFDFIDDGRIAVDHAQDGVYYGWNYDKGDNTVTLNLNKEAQTLNIEKLNDKEMVLQNDKQRYSFVKVQKNSDANPLLLGYWMLIGDDDPYKVIHLKKDNSVYEIERIDQAPIENNYSELKGKWIYNASESSIIFNTNKYNALCSGKYTIKKLDDIALVLRRDNFQLIFLKIDPERIKKDNEESGFIGLWKVTTRAGKTTYYNLQSPYIFTTGKSKDSMYGKGLWFYNPAVKRLFLGYQTFPLEAEIVVNKISKDKIELGGYTAERVK